MRTHVALLRAVNVSGTGKLPMADLRVLASKMGLDEAATVVQSGSLAFRSDDDSAGLEQRLTDALAETFSLKTTVLVRTAAEWRGIVESNPYPEAARDDPGRLIVMPLSAEPEAGRLDDLHSAIVGRETVELQGRTLYAIYPDGIGESKLLIGVIEKRLGVKTTGRNWNTTLKIAALLG